MLKKLRSAPGRTSLVVGMLGVVLFAAACPGTGNGPRQSDLRARREQAALQAVAALQAGRFEEAERSAHGVLSSDDKNPRARLVSALSGYILLGDRLFKDFITLLEGVDRGVIDHAFARNTLEKIEKNLAQLDADLEVAARDPEVSMELCLACWEADWNRNGRIDSRDRRLFEIEEDETGQSIPSDDPRRRPTFRFDIGDVYWARAMLSFQRALIELLLGYRLADLGSDLQALSQRLTREQGSLTIHLADKRRIVAARELILAGIAHAERSQKEYQAETDDDREWVPNPRQKNHPMPLPVDDALYQTWAAILVDTRQLIAGEEGLGVAEAMKLVSARMPFQPSGFLSIRKLLFEPKDLVINVPDLKDALLRPDAALRSLFGDAYVSSMKPSQLLSRLARMREEVRRGDESFNRKLRYLFWLN